jgi:hypothetical protein
LGAGRRDIQTTPQPCELLVSEWRLLQGGARPGMMSKAWYKGPLRYLLMRAQLGCEEAWAHLSGANLSDAIAKGVTVFRKDLTRTIFFTGVAALLSGLPCLHA